jgi:hypothetical protein
MEVYRFPHALEDGLAQEVKAEWQLVKGRNRVTEAIV